MSAPGPDFPRLIYKLLSRAEWEAALSAGVYTGSEHDRRDGFIHFSSASQLAETARKHFSHVNDLMMLEVNAEGLGDALKWEPSRGGALFPHLYGALALEHVRAAAQITRDADGTPLFRLPCGQSASSPVKAQS